MNNLAKVLLVDDSENDANLFRIFLMEEEGIEMQLDVARNGMEALEKLNNSDDLPDIVLLDVNMPRLDGFEVLDNIRNKIGLNDLPVSMLSTSGDELDIERAFENGADHYMVKPADYEQIQTLVHDIPNLSWDDANNSKRIVLSDS